MNDVLERLKGPLALIANREDRVEVDAELLLDLQTEIEELKKGWDRSLKITADLQFILHQAALDNPAGFG